MFIRFPVAIDIIDETRADVRLILFPVRFDFVGVFFARIAFPEKWQVRRAWRPDPDAFPVEVCPRAVRYYVMGTVGKAQRDW